MIGLRTLWLALLVGVCLIAGGHAGAQTKPTTPKKTSTVKKSSTKTTTTTKTKTPTTTKKATSTTTKPAKPVKPAVADSGRAGQLTVDSAFVARRDTSKGKDSVRVSNDLSTTVNYAADDSIVFSPKSRIARLYGDANITYGDINLKAEQVQINYETNIVDANGVPDSTGKMAGVPVFMQGNDKYQAERMSYNFKTRKGLIRTVITQQGDGYIHGQAVKRESDKAFFVKNAEYTTCDLEHPHFYIKSYKMKMVPGQKIISGPFLLHIADVPTPLGFIFGFFPIPKFKSSGIIIPTYGETSSQGFFLRNGGFYFALSDYFDLKLLGEIYSLGGWGLTPQSNYRKRYKYEGSVQVRYNKRSSELTDGRRVNASEDFFLTWNHTPQAQGNSRFSASVQLGSNTYNQRYAIQQQNIFTTNFTSSVAYSTSFPGTPFNLSVSARSNQNTRTKSLDVDLPTASVAMNRIYPFKTATTTKSNILTNLNIAYTFTAQNTITNARPVQSFSLPVGVRVLEPPILDTSQVAAATGIRYIPVSGSSLPLLLRQAKFGARHDIPIATTFRMLRYFNVTPSFNYQETWLPSRQQFNYTIRQNPTTNVIDTGLTVDTVRGFNRFYSFSTGASVSTQIYGTFFIRRGNLEAIRHRLTPTIGFSYRPDFGTPAFGFFQNSQINPIANVNGGGDRYAYLNPYQGYVYPGPSTGGRTGSINFSLTNVVEAKLRNSSDSGKSTFTKRNLIENLGLSGSYNAIADSFNLSNIGITLNTRLFDKINIASGAIFDPYSYENRAVEGTGVTRNLVRRPKYSLEGGQGLGRFTSANLSFGYTFQPKPAKSKGPVKKPENLTEGQEQELSFIRNNPNLFVDFNIPYSLSLQYNLTYAFLATGEKTFALNQYVQTSGDVSISPKWKVGFNAPFDFQTKRFSSTSLTIYRDLHCWEMRMYVLLSGIRPMYTFDINVKASVLQDLKLSKRNSFYDR